MVYLLIFKESIKATVDKVALGNFDRNRKRNIEANFNIKLKSCYRILSNGNKVKFCFGGIKMKKRIWLTIACFWCIFSISSVYGQAESTKDVEERASMKNIEKMNEIVNNYNDLYFESYTEDELKSQESFQKSIHLLNELYFEYGSLEKIPILPFDAVEPREGDKLFVNVVAIIEGENGEKNFVEDFNNADLLEECLASLGYYNENKIRGEKALTEAIKKIQTEEDMEVNGIADEVLWRKIDTLMQ